jgi:predicted DCC family thiol-disulfide oxidoreductase YuxK
MLFEMQRAREMARAGTASLPPRLVLYDGVCVFCNRSVQWLLAADRDARLRFAPLQGATAAELRRRHPEIPADIDTIVYVETADGTERVSLRSDAIFRIYAALELKSRLMPWMRRLPRWCTDLAYRLFVRFRYRIFGRLDVCPVPSAEQRDRFLP